MTSVWLRAESVTCVEALTRPITTPRGFGRRERRRRRWREPREIFRDVTVRSTGGLSIVTGTTSTTAALASLLVGVLRPHVGRVESSHRPVGVLRARPRLLVDLRIRSAILRELRLRGIPTSYGWDVVDEACRMAGVDPRSWASDLDRQQYARLAPAAVVCTDAPIVVLDSVFNGQSPEFDEVLLQRLAARSRRLDLVTILCAPERRGIDELVDALEVQQIQALPRGRGDDPSPARGLLDDEDDEDEDDEDDDESDYGVSFDQVDVVDVVSRSEPLVTFDDVRLAQFGGEVDTIDGRAPFTIRIGVASGFEGSTLWSLRLVHRSANVVLASADGTSESAPEVRTLVVDLPGGLSSGRLALHARVEGLAEGRHSVVLQPNVSFVPIMVSDDEAPDAVATGQLSFAP